MPRTAPATRRAFFTRPDADPFERFELRLCRLYRGKRLGTLLVEAGSLTADELVRGVMAQVEAIRATPEPRMLVVNTVSHALGQAAGLCPGVAASLKRKHPGGFELDADQALLFLKEYTEGLRAAGFAVILPSWWVGRGPVKRIGLKARAHSPKMQTGGRGLSLNDMIDFDYVASLGGEALSLDELKALGLDDIQAFELLDDASRGHL